MAMDADVRLLIGVARGGADGDSEALIRKELNEIMGKIKLEAKLDSKSFGEQIRKQLDAISKNGKFYVNLSKINIGAGAIADFRRQLNTVINTLNLDKGTSITLTAEGIGEVKSKIKETATVTDEAARKMAEFNVQIAAMKKQSKNIDTGLGSLSKGATAEEAAQVTALLERYKAWQVEFETLRLQGVDGSNERRKALEDEAAAILVNIQRINEEREATAEAAQAKVQAEREAKAADDATVTAENRKNAAMKQGVMLLTQMQKAEQDWTAAQSGRSSEHYNNIRQGTVYLQEYLGQLERGEISVDEFQRRLAGLRTSFAESSNAIKSAGENTKTLSERVGGLAAKFTSWLTVSQIVMKLYSSLKKMVSAVIDIDTAMTELKKVTDETSAVYAKYLDDASVRAKKLGATIADTVTASADFARLGYTLDEAAQLADAALVYYQYVFPVSCRLTKFPGEVCSWLQIFSGTPSNPTIAKSGECLLYVEESKNMDDYICDHQLSAIYEMQKKTEDTESNMDAIQEEIDKLVKGDDVIHFTSNSGNDPVDEDAVIQF